MFSDREKLAEKGKNKSAWSSFGQIEDGSVLWEVCESPIFWNLRDLYLFARENFVLVVAGNRFLFRGDEQDIIDISWQLIQHELMHAAADGYLEQCGGYFMFQRINGKPGSAGVCYCPLKWKGYFGLGSLDYWRLMETEGRRNQLKNVPPELCFEVAIMACAPCVQAEQLPFGDVISAVENGPHREDARLFSTGVQQMADIAGLGLDLIKQQVSQEAIRRVNVNLVAANLQFLLD